MRRLTLKLALSCSAAVAALTGANGALAQTSASQGSAAAAADGATIGELVVTAQRREEKLRDVPATVNVVTGDQLAAAGPILTTGDILSGVPGVRFNNLQNPLLSEVTIRGSGTGRATGADPAVGLFANGVYVGGGGGFGRNFALIDSFDLARAEVLSGPQGALYGRNAEYGVVNLVSQQPKFSDEGYADDSYIFQTKSNRLTGVVNYKLADDLAIRLGAQVTSQDGGFVFNPDAQSYYDVTQGWMGRAQIRWAPGKWDVNLNASIQRMQLPAYQQVSDILPGTLATFPLGLIGNRSSIPIDGENSTHEDIDSIVLTANYDFGWGKLASTSSYRKRTDTQYRGFTGTSIDAAGEAAAQKLGEIGAYPFSGVVQLATTDMYYEDLHLSGVALDDRLNWLVGADGLHFESDGDSSKRADPCATAASPNPKIGAGVCGGTPTEPTCTLLTPGATPCPAIFPSTFGARSVTKETYESWAAYTSLSYKLTKDLTFTGDLRITSDHKTQSGTTFNLYTTTPLVFVTGGGAANLSGTYDKSVPTYTATLSYKLPERWSGLVYAKVGTGYRAGDFNTASSPPLINGLLGGKAPPAGYAPATQSYGDETLTSYEVGYKGNITSSAFVTLTAYTSKMDNALVAVGDGCALNNACITNQANYVVNAGTVQASGVEATLNTTWALLGGQLNSQFTGTDQTATYTSVPSTRPGLAAGQATGLPLQGTSVPQTPHWLAGATINYRRPITDALEGFANLTYYGQWGGIQDPAVAALPGIALANYQDLGLRGGVDYRNMEFAFFIENLTNETHIQLVAAQHSTQAALPYFPTALRFSNPRTVGLEVKYKW